MKPAHLANILAAGAILLWPHLAQAAEPAFFSLQLSKKQSIRGLRIPLGMQNDGKPTISVFCGEVSIEPKRAGFLRIGPVPQPVISGMRLEIFTTEGLAWTGDFLRFAMHEAALERVEIRGLEIRLPAGERLSVRAGDARLVPGKGILRLRSGQIYEDGRVTHLFGEGEVFLEGAKAATLEWREGETVRSIALGGIGARAGSP